MQELEKRDKGKPKVSVVVCCYNAEKYLPKCLNALKAQTYPNFEIIVVDDGSTDKTSEVAEKYGVRLIRIKHSGLPAARNVGVRSANGDVIAFTDADCVVESRWLEKLINKLTSGDYAGVIGGIVKVLNSESFVARCLGIRTEAKPLKCYAGGYNVAYWKKIIKKMNGFDNSFSRGGDYEFYLRVSKIHKIAWAKDATVFFRYPATVRELVSKSVADGAGFRKILNKHPWHLKNVIFVLLKGLAALIFPPLLIIVMGRTFKQSRSVKYAIGHFFYAYASTFVFSIGFVFSKVFR